MFMFKNLEREFSKCAELHKKRIVIEKMTRYFMDIEVSKGGALLPPMYIERDAQRKAYNMVEKLYQRDNKLFNRLYEQAYYERGNYES